MSKNDVQMLVVAPEFSATARFRQGVLLGAEPPLDSFLVGLKLQCSVIYCSDRRGWDVSLSKVAPT